MINVVREAKRNQVQLFPSCVPTYIYFSERIYLCLLTANFAHDSMIQLARTQIKFEFAGQ